METIDDVNRRIDNNYNFVKNIENQIRKCSDNIEKINLIKFVCVLYSEFVTGVYSDNYLEDELNKLGKEIIPRIHNNSENKTDKILFVMTQAYETGGHTVIVNNWIKWDNINDYDVILTNQKISAAPKFLKECVDNAGGKIYSLEGDYISKATQLKSISSQYKAVILMTHMFDVLPNLAYSGNDFQTPVFFYLHADFKFVIGLSVSDIIMHLCPWDVDKSVKYRGVSQEKALVIEFPNDGKILENKITEIKEVKNDLKEYVKSKYKIDENVKLIVSMGADLKYKKIIDYDFCDFAYRLVKEYKNCRFLIIGADSRSERWKSTFEISNGKVEALGMLPREEATMIISLSDLYISSFPMTASGAEIAKSYGVPYISLKLIDRFKPVNDINCASNIEELVKKSLILLNDKNTQEKEKNILSIERIPWCKKWNDLLKSVKKHKNSVLNSQRFIEKQEVINCQLMQENSSNIAWQFGCQDITLSKDTLRLFFSMCDEYNISPSLGFQLEYVKKLLDDGNDVLLEKRRENRIDICYIIDSNEANEYIFLEVSILSIFENTNSKIVIHMLHDNIDEKVLLDLKKIADIYNQEVLFYDVNDICMIYNLHLNNFKYKKDALLYHCLIGYVLPCCVSKVIYLSDKTVVNCDIANLYSINLNNYSIAALPEHRMNFGICNIHHSTQVDERKNFNSDVLLLDLLKLRNSCWSDKFVEVLNKNDSNLEIKNVLNCIFFENYEKIDLKFNYSVIYHQLLGINKIGNGIYNYAGVNIDLINLNSVYDKMFLKYFIKTPFFDVDMYILQMNRFFEIKYKKYSSLYNFIATKRLFFLGDGDQIKKNDAIKLINNEKYFINIYDNDKNVNMNNVIRFMSENKDERTLYIFITENYDQINNIMNKVGLFKENLDYINGNFLK